MLKMLIADDEYLVLDAIKMLVSKSAKDIDVVATASTGREAIEKAINLKPDIVFMDIHMPGINGIEAIKRIKDINYDTLFVILTAYEYFDYAKEALNLGVFEYLLKPINKNKLIDSLNNICTYIYRKREKLIKEIELKEKMNRILPSLEAQFITYILFNVGTLKDINFYENIFSMKLRQGYAMTVLLVTSECKLREDNLKLNLQRQNFYDIFSMKLKSICPCLIGSLMPDRIIVFIPAENEEDDSPIRYNSIEVAKKIIEKIDSFSDLSYKIGIGKKYDLERFGKSCNEAYIAAAKAQLKSVIHFELIIPSDNKFDTYLLQKESLFSSCIRTANIKEAKEIFIDIYLWLINICGEDIDKIKSKLIDLLFIIDKNLPYELKELEELKQAYILNVLKINDRDELRIQFIRYLSDITAAIQMGRKNDIDGIIPTVLDYLNRNYYNDISLNDLAKSVNLSYNYLSKVFKDEIGKSFIDYLTELRIDRSMKLLANQSISIKEVCQKIGYNDPNYYCKAFKKITGMTPTEYRTFINMGSDCIDKE